MLLKPICFKDILKIRWLWMTLMALNALLMVYIYIETHRLFALDHAEVVWYRVDCPEFFGRRTGRVIESYKL
jgi:hypothetical protein